MNLKRNSLVWYPYCLEVLARLGAERGEFVVALVWSGRLLHDSGAYVWYPPDCDLPEHTILAQGPHGHGHTNDGDWRL
jgi:hypothetical protein